MYKITNQSPLDNSDVCPACGLTRNSAAVTLPILTHEPTSVKDLTPAHDYFNSLAPEAYVRQKLLLQIVPISNATLWRKVKSVEFPRPVKFSPMVTAWRVSEVRAWLEKFKAAKKR